MSIPTYRDLWRRIAQVSASCRKLVVPSSPSPPSLPLPVPKPSGQPPFPSLNLTVPADFTAFIHELQLPPLTLERILSRVQYAVDEQKTIHEQKYQELCRKFQQLNLPSTSSKHQAYYDGIKKSHENSFQRHLLQIQESVEKIHEQVRQATSSAKKAVFNAEYTPVLEQYFEYNAYPSARDRELLARKSSMTPRQIEVWFQNHRRRARKEGRHLKRISTDPLPTNLSLDVLQEQMPAFMLRKEKEEQQTLSLEDKIALPAPLQNLPSPAPTPAPGATATPVFSLDDTPSHSRAWPAAYSPRDGRTLFTSSHAFQFETPVWYRKASPPSSSRSPCGSIDGLCSDFRSRLHLGGAGTIRKQRDYTFLLRSVATRQRYAIAAYPALIPSPAGKSATRTHVCSEAPIEFGYTSSLRSRKRHQPYDLSSRKHPNWSPDKTSKSRSTPSRPSTTQRKLSSPIPRTPSLSSISSSDSSYCSDPPTPRDSPSSSFIQSLPHAIETSDGRSEDDPYAFVFSTDTVISSYPSSTERYTLYPKP